MAEKVGFIGLGEVGLPMAKRVITHGYRVAVCGHVRREPVEEMKRLGAKEVSTPKEVAQESDVTITMLRDDGNTEKVVLGNQGIVSGGRKGCGIILMSTLSPALCRHIASVARSKGMNVIDAPVTGTRMRAATGELGIMVGGDKKIMERYRPILETMGKITYCGELGMGEIVKLASNMALMINVQGAYEAVSWAIRNGADEGVLLELMRTGTANSWVVQNWEWVKSMNVEPPPLTFYHGLKDLGYALGIARDIGQPCPLAALCEGRFRTGVLTLPDKQVLPDGMMGTGKQAQAAADSGQSLAR
jgi:3-hydroxyisobutyrate dehydrogenase-like beta-hydroxyacid dehydrogenase